ncbi:MAG TPA: DNA adenine methylase [Solirubrobacterales bacterium]|nr:DNA adenine methylase [Solirubrobacterales bacterium]
MAYRYIGNKTRLLPWLLSLIDREVPEGGTVADLMCGTASVAAALRERGYRVIASDLMTFSVHHARVRLKLSRTPHFGRLGLGSYPEVLEALNRLEPSEGLFFTEYSPAGQPAAGCKPRQYLSAENAGRLDSIMAEISRFEADGLLSENAISLLRHDAVLATNRVANIAGTYGHYWSKWTKAALSPLQLRPTMLPSTARTDHVVTQGRAEDVAPSVAADLCYLDPPYTKRQYAANYHLIETVARGDEPEAVGVSGLRPWRDQYSDFCSKVRLRDAFSQVIEGVDAPKFLISYSEDGLVPRDEMLEFLADFGAVSCEQISFPRFRSNQSDLPQFLTEYAFLLDCTRSPSIEIRPETTLTEIDQLSLLSSS